MSASVDGRDEDGAVLLHFEGEEPVELLLERAGRMPLPPYIASRRPADRSDRDDYQTMFAREDGAVAAPTAALHFTPKLIEALEKQGIGRETLTLHVGAGTFLPVKAEDTSEHKMHSEWGRVDAETANRLNGVRASGGRLIAVGTTSLRLLESAAGEDGVIGPFEGDTAIFITPGYRFKAVNGLITNFHLPRSTLFMLVSALMGLDVMKKAYAHAVEEKYRFYSYGDASLLLPPVAETSLPAAFRRRFLLSLIERFAVDGRINRFKELRVLPARHSVVGRLAFRRLEQAADAPVAAFAAGEAARRLVLESSTDGARLVAEGEADARARFDGRAGKPGVKRILELGGRDKAAGLGFDRVRGAGSEHARHRIPRENANRERGRQRRHLSPNRRRCPRGLNGAHSCKVHDVFVPVDPQPFGHGLGFDLGERVA